MKLLLEFFPIIFFFIFYKYAGLNVAIIAMTFATMLQILYTRWQTKKYEKMQVITLGLLILFGGLTISVNDPAFIMWKVSVIKVMFGAFILATLFTRQTIMEKFMGGNLQAPVKVWRKITHLWGWSFIGMAMLNAYFVVPALEVRERFLPAGAEFDSLRDKYSDLSILDCATTHNVNLCLEAQRLEAVWVNFKLFGSLGVTLVILIITILMLKNYIKNDGNNDENNFTT